MKFGQEKNYRRFGSWIKLKFLLVFQKKEEGLILFRIVNGFLVYEI